MSEYIINALKYVEAGLEQIRAREELARAEERMRTCDERVAVNAAKAAESLAEYREENVSFVHPRDKSKICRVHLTDKKGITLEIIELTDYPTGVSL